VAVATWERIRECAPRIDPFHPWATTPRRSDTSRLVAGLPWIRAALPRFARRNSLVALCVSQGAAPRPTWDFSPYRLSGSPFAVLRTPMRSAPPTRGLTLPRGGSRDVPASFVSGFPVPPGVSLGFPALRPARFVGVSRSRGALPPQIWAWLSLGAGDHRGFSARFRAQFTLGSPVKGSIAMVSRGSDCVRSLRRAHRLWLLVLPPRPHHH